MLQGFLIVWLLVGSIACSVMAVLAFSQYKTFNARIFIGLMISGAVYILGYSLELNGKSLEQILLFVRFEYFGAAFIPAFWLLLALSYTDRPHWIKFPRWLLFFVIPIVVIISVNTNHLHHQFYRSVALETSGPYPTLEFERGPIYWVHAGYGFFALLSSIILLGRGLSTPHSLFRRQTAIMLGAAVSMVTIYLLYQLGLQPLPNMDMVAIGLTIASLILGWGFFKYRLVELPPFARERLFEILRDAVFILDDNSRLVDFNLSASKLLRSPDRAIGLKITDVLNDEIGPALKKLCLQLQDVTVEFHTSCNHFFEVSCVPLNTIQGEPYGQLLLLHDSTDLKKAQLELMALNNELEERVKLSTQDAEATIRDLEIEISNRKEVEARLQTLQENLINRVASQSRKLNDLYDVLLYRDQDSDIDAIMTRTMSKIQEMMAADAVCFNECWKDEQFHLIGGVGLSDLQTQLVNVLPSGWERKDIPLMSPDLPSEMQLPEKLRQTGFTTYLGSPVNLNRSNLGLLQAFWLGHQAISVEDISMFTIIAEQFGIILENARLRRGIEERAVMFERRRLARDLHDSVTQSLHGLLLQSEVLRHRLETNKLNKVYETLDHLDVNARQALKEMRLLLYEMRLTPLEEVHLIDALTTRIEAVERKAGIEASIHVGEPAHWPASWEAELYPIALEALNNSLKNAFAKSVWIRIRGSSDWAVLEVEDDGKGFDLENLPKGGMGTNSMRERAERLGGRLEIKTKPGSGTLVRVVVGNTPEKWGS